jgi:serine protease
MRNLLLILVLIGAALLAPIAPHQRGLQAASASPLTARVIVKYKADSSLLRRQAQSAAAARADRAQALGARVGLALRSGRAITGRSHVVFADGISSAELAERLAQQSDVEYAVPDQRRRILAAPNDPYYAAGPAIVGLTGGPVVGQWYLHAPAGEVQSSINIEAAWDITPGSPGVTVAVLDTGVRFDHRDLKTVAAGGKLLPGYDLVGPDLSTTGASLGTYQIANDGNGIDSDPSDPGDWITQAEANDPNGQFYQCGAQDDNGNYVGENSSWHGTQTAGLIGALTNNGEGMAGVGRNVRVLPVRVLGKCGGYDSDIIAGMYWAVNATDPDEGGLPANPNPAQVISMSLGGPGTCDADYQDVIAAVTAKGAVIVASAGNDEGHVVSLPANCPGVVAVAGLRHVGTKVGFSNIGAQVSLSAPGGNCVNIDANEPCLYSILTTANAGTTTPVSDAAGGSIYTDAFARASFGTSFSAPMVAGTAALMLSIQPKLTPAEVLAKLKGTARPFPTTGGTAGTVACVVPGSAGAPTDQDECYCTTGTCGAGMLDAGKAVASAAGVQARVTVTTATPTAASPVTLSAADSLLTTGHSITKYLWSVTSAGGVVSSFTGATDGATATITPTAAGTFQVQLSATDNTGITSSETKSITVVAAAVTPPLTPPANGSSGGGGAVDATWIALLGLAVLLLAALPGAPRRD